MRDLLDLVAEERDPVRRLLVRGLHLHDVALDAKAPAPENRVVADVLALDELPQHVVAVVLLPHLEDQHALAPLLGRAEAVDAGDRRDHDDVASGQERGGGRQPQPGDVVVLRRVLLDVEVGLRDVGLGLVVVVVGDEVLDRVLGEELPELVAELRGERLVVRDHERGALDLLDRPRHRRRLPGAGRAEQGLEAVACDDRGRDLLDRARLVARGRVQVGRLELPHRLSVAAAFRRALLEQCRTDSRADGMTGRSVIAVGHDAVPSSSARRRRRGHLGAADRSEALGPPRARSCASSRRSREAARERAVTGSSSTCSSTRSCSWRRPRQRARAGTCSPSSSPPPSSGRWRDVRAARRARATTRGPLLARRATARCATSTRSAPRSHAGGRSSTSRGRRRSSTRTRPDGRSSSSARCGARETASAARPPPGRSCAGTRTSSASGERERGLKPPAGGKCPPGARLTQGASEMLHVWFTGELRSAFAIRAPEPELCAAGLPPRSYCGRR